MPNVIIYGPDGNALAPSAAAEADAVANPTLSKLGTYLHGFNGTTWDRLRTQFADGSNPAGVLAVALELVDSSGFYRQYNAATVGDGAGGRDSASVAPALYNGASWDQQRANQESTLLASAARTSATSSADQTNYNGRGVLILLNVTGNAGVGKTLSLQVDVKDPISGAYLVYIASAVLVTNATGVVDSIHYPGQLDADLNSPGAGLTSNRKAAAIPRTWRVTVTPSDATSWTYSVSACTIL